MMLSDRDIRCALEQGELGIDPFTEDQLQPASYDVRLSRYFAETCPGYDDELFDLKMPAQLAFRQLETDRVILPQGGFTLATLQERIWLGPGIAAQIAGKSSLGRLGLMIHVTAGFVDPGWDGYLTLELYNCSPWDLVLYEGMKIGQVTFYRLETPCERVYGTEGLGSKHMSKENRRPVISQYWKNFKES